MRAAWTAVDWPEALKAWGHCDPSWVAGITCLRWTIGSWGSCHRREPVGGAANRMLWSSVSLSESFRMDWPFEGVQIPGRIEDTLVDRISKINDRTRRRADSAGRRVPWSDASLERMEGVRMILISDGCMRYLNASSNSCKQCEGLHRTSWWSIAYGEWWVCEELKKEEECTECELLFTGRKGYGKSSSNDYCTTHLPNDMKSSVENQAGSGTTEMISTCPEGRITPKELHVLLPTRTVQNVPEQLLS